MSARPVHRWRWHAPLLLAVLLLSACSSDEMEGTPVPETPAPEQPVPQPSPQPDPLASWFQGGFAGKKVVFWGNSTVSEAVYFFDQLRTYTGAGGRLEGLDPARILNYGSNGASLAAMLNGQGRYAIAAVIAAHPDLLVIRGPLINDVRLGFTSLEVAKQLLQSALGQIAAGSPGTAVLLTTENSLLTVDVGGHGYVQPNDAAQQYTDILRAAVLAMKDKYPNVKIADVMYLEYGTVSLPQSSLMIDQLHPSEAGQRTEADVIANLIGKP
jgi:lysophospholipase L1-like esterase